MSLLNKSNLNKTELSELNSINNLTSDYMKKRSIEIQKILKNCREAILIDPSDNYLKLKLFKDNIYHFLICNIEYKYVMNFGYIKYEDLNKLIQNKEYIYAYIDDKQYKLKV